MTELNSASVPGATIAERQEFAKRLGEQISGLIQNNRELSEIGVLMLWHGSLPRASGGINYDIDYAIFLRVGTPPELLEAARLFTKKVIYSSQELTWRDDLHYDGMMMFEVHTHWDTVKRNLPHIGAHFYREAALQELFGEFDWRAAWRTGQAFFRLLESWRRYCFFYRHWIYEGIPLYDPCSIYEKAKKLGCSPPTWLVAELRDVVLCILRGYATSSSGICTVPDSKQLALDMVATMAYALERKPMGRSSRYESDVQEFQNELAGRLLRAVIRKDLVAAAELSKSLAKLADW